MARGYWGEEAKTRKKREVLLDREREKIEGKETHKHPSVHDAGIVPENHVIDPVLVDDAIQVLIVHHVRTTWYYLFH